MEEVFRIYRGGGVQEPQRKRCSGSTEKEVFRDINRGDVQEVFRSHTGGGVQDL